MSWRNHDQVCQRYRPPPLILQLLITFSFLGGAKLFSCKALCLQPLPQRRVLVNNNNNNGLDLVERRPLPYRPCYSSLPLSTRKHHAHVLRQASSSSDDDNNNDDDKHLEEDKSLSSANLSLSISFFRKTNAYWKILRPATLLQAVGALWVGRLVVQTTTTAPLQNWLSSSVFSELAAALSVYLSYGAGMVANDCADSSIDASDAVKQKRPIPAGVLSPRQGWLWTATLALVSLVVAAVGVGRNYALWCGTNLFLTVAYALQWQRYFLIKNILVGWLCVSPLVGATLVGNTQSALAAKDPLYFMASVGFLIGVAREILKDAQDVDIDRGEKSTLPLVVGVRMARLVSMILVGTTLA